MCFAYKYIIEYYICSLCAIYLCRCAANNSVWCRAKRKLFFMQKLKNYDLVVCFFFVWFFFYFCRIEITLTRCGAPNNLKIDPNCVANGAVYANEYVGALDGIGNIDAHSYGSLSAKYWTRIGTSSSESILRIIFCFDFCRCTKCRFRLPFSYVFDFNLICLVQKFIVSVLETFLFLQFPSCTLNKSIDGIGADQFSNGLNLLCSFVRIISSEEREC